MKVLKNNNYITVECPRCKSSLGVFSKDIHYNEISHHSSTFEVSCEACGKSFGIDSKLIPQSWKDVIIPD